MPCRNMLIQHSFIFSQCFFLVRVAVDPDSILGILRAKWEYTMDRICQSISVGNMH